MLIKNIKEGWQLSGNGVEGVVPATVPGSVYLDLLNCGQMEDPFWRDNELDALKRMEKDYCYSTTFDANGYEGCDEVVLRLEGIDTISTISLNGIEIGTTDNMHRSYEFSVKKYLQEKQNQLKITIFSSLNYIEECHKKLLTVGCIDAMEGFPQLRKEHCAFGWDWGPRIPDAGIYREVKLLGINKARISSVYLSQHHEKDRVRLAIEPDIAFLQQEEKEVVSYEVLVIDPDGSITKFSDSPTELIIENKQLWWPRGYGEQPLYQVEIVLYTGEQELDRFVRRIGLRTISVNRKKDQFGESFAHVVNDVEVFAMGADYIPEDNVIGRITKERTRRLLEQCAAANFNCIRIWGGGYYPDDHFFDSCDELGLMVWVDFMFACAVYELTDEFEANIRAEFKDVILRLRHHACLALWCGNNEMEMFVAGGGWGNTPKQMSDYFIMYEHILPKMIRQYNPNTFYWPASPSSGGGFDSPNDENRGDVHYWDVWHGGKPFSEFRKFYFRYVSEFGFQSFPTAKTVESFTLPEDRNIFSYVMEKHQRNNSANGRIMNYMQQTYLYPTDFNVLLYASQLLQAEAIKYGVEHFRRNRGRCMGTIYWQLNDIWPVASWASIDYYGRWKALHYFAKRFFAPLLLSCKEEGMLTQQPNINAQPKPLKKSVQFNVANETFDKKSVKVIWTVRNAASEVLQRTEEALVVEPLTSSWLPEVELPELNIFEEYVSYELWENGNLLSESSVIFTLPKYFHYKSPVLSVGLEGNEIVVTSQAYAKSIEIRNENEDLILEDNYFDMNRGKRRIKLISGAPEKLAVRCVTDIH